MPSYSVQLYYLTGAAAAPPGPSTSGYGGWQATVTAVVTALLLAVAR